MKYPISKIKNKQYQMVGYLVIGDDDSISCETDDLYLRGYINDLVDLGIRIPIDVSGTDEHGRKVFGEADETIKPDDPGFLSAIEYNLPSNYTVKGHPKEKQIQYRKTA